MSARKLRRIREAIKINNAAADELMAALNKQKEEEKQDQYADSEPFCTRETSQELNNITPAWEQEPEHEWDKLGLSEEDRKDPIFQMQRKYRE